MLKFQGVKQIFGDLSINYPDWEVKDGDRALILGNSGSGKTTMLHIAAGLLKPSQGDVFISGQNLAKMSTAQMDHFRGQNIGLIFQKPHLVKSLTVEENVKLAGQFSGKKVSDSRLNEVLEHLGIASLKGRKVHQLSEGQAQRVSIARAVVHEPKLLIADEPTASLDDHNCEKVISLLRNQAERCGATLLIATHDQRVKDEFSNCLTL